MNAIGLQGLLDYDCRNLTRQQHPMLLLATCLVLLFWLLESGLHYHSFGSDSLVHAFLPNESNELWMRTLVCGLLLAFGVYADIVIRRMKRGDAERRQLQERLEEALTHALRGFLPICSNCKQIREETESWSPLETYVREHSATRFTHTLCPSCAHLLYPDEYPE